MAQLAPDPYPLPAISFGSTDLWHSDHQIELERLEAVSKTLPDGEYVGGIVRWQIADGFAQYLITSWSPLVLQHVPAWDAYEVDAALIRGLRQQDVKSLVDRQRVFNKGR